MARVIYGGVGLQGLSGSINKTAGGHTFTKNNVVRRRVIPVNPKSSSQSLIRNAFAFLTTYWGSTLTEEQRRSWETAKTDRYYYKQDGLNGVARPYASGKDLFLAMNQNILIATNELTQPTVSFVEPGVPANLDEITGVSVAIDASAETVAMTYTGTFSSETAYIKMTPPVSAGNMKASTVNTQSRVIGEDFGSSPVALGADYMDRFGGLTQSTGKKVFWEVIGVNNGTGKTRTIASGQTIIVA